jgi:photosystem I P700 chlorophyll a apoprotein A2
MADLGAKETPAEVRMELSSDVLFEFDKADILQEAEASLNKVAGVVKGFKSPAVMIFGHTDSKGADDYNLKLSRRRADSVKEWLVKKGGIDERIIQTTGFGKSKPKVPNTKQDGSDDPEGRRKNRRVEIVVKKK